MKHIRLAARWEFAGMLRNRQFILLTLLIPLILLGSMLLSILFAAPEIREGLAGVQGEQLPRQLEASLGEDLERVISTVLAAAFASIFLFVVLFSGTFVLQNIVREKQSRVVEMLLAAITPRQLVASKTLAFGALGLVQAAIWVAVGIVALLAVGPYVGMPTWPLLGLLLAYMPWGKLALFVLYFVLGYLFIASFSAGMGATMTDVFSGQQIQSLIVLIPTLLPLMFLNLLVENPHNGFFLALSYFPPSIPGAMMLRLSLASVATAEVILSLIVLAIATVGMMRLAGKVFEVGILMYGKSASLSEIWRWVRR